MGLVRHAGGCESGVHEWVDNSRDFAGVDGNWPQGFTPDCVVHLAARVHMLNDDAADPEAAFQATNVDGAMRVARSALRHGALRFVFVSSIKAIAEADAGRPLREDDTPLPQDRLRTLEAGGRKGAGRIRPARPGSTWSSSGRRWFMVRKFAPISCV